MESEARGYLARKWVYDQHLELSQLGGREKQVRFGYPVSASYHLAGRTGI